MDGKRALQEVLVSLNQYHTTITYQLSQHLARVLSPLVGNSSSHMQNSLNFANLIHSQVLQEDENLASFDLVLLFTNVPVDLAVSAARCRLQEDDSFGEHTSLCVEEVMKLVVFYLSATYLAF